VFAPPAASANQGGVALFYRSNTGGNWSLEGIRAYGPNVVRATLVSGEERWLIVGAYIPPSETNGETIGFISTAANSSDHILILLGDLNVDLDKIVNERHAETAGTIASLGVTDILLSFRHRKWRDRHTFRRFQSGSWRFSRCDYILAENRDNFLNVCTLTLVSSQVITSW
jgi:hypothetical protein